MLEGHKPAALQRVEIDLASAVTRLGQSSPLRAPAILEVIGIHQKILPKGGQRKAWPQGPGWATASRLQRRRTGLCCRRKTKLRFAARPDWV